MVKSLSALGFRHEDICIVMQVRSPKTLRKHFREELLAGMAEANALLSRTAHDMAFSGDYTAMTLFWDKCHGGQPEQIDEEEPLKDWNVEVRFPGKTHAPGEQTEDGRNAQA